MAKKKEPLPPEKLWPNIESKRSAAKWKIYATRERVVYAGLSDRFARSIVIQTRALLPESRDAWGAARFNWLYRTYIPYSSSNATKAQVEHIKQVLVDLTEIRVSQVLVNTGSS